MKNKPKLIVFASGTSSGGGSGFQELVENSKTGILNAEIVAVVSNHSDGGVFKIAKNNKIPFEYFDGPFEKENYQAIIKKYSAEWVSLSGWLKLFSGHPANRTINIHPGILPQLGGKGMYGHFVHEAAVKMHKEDKLGFSAVSMHFVTEKYDEGPVFFCYPVLIRQDDTAQTLANRVSKIEHAYQSWITSLVINGDISWDGKDKNSLSVPSWYPFLPKLT